MADPQWLMGALAADNAYRGDDPPWPDPTGMGSVLGMGALMPPPRNPAAPPQGVVDMFVPNLSRSETYAPRSAELQPNAAGKVPTSDPFTTGAMSDLANMAGYAMPGPGGAAKAAAILGLGAGRRLVVPAEEAAAKIRAYHSSPHDFERFDASKIGTGEGAQVYGHGIYFAENPKVSGQGGEYWKQFLGKFPDQSAERRAAELLGRYKFDRAKALADEELNINLKYPLRVEDFGSNALEFPGYAKAQVEQRNLLHQETKRLLESGKPVGPRTYEVEIAARPEQMLDWDKPLAQQPQGVQEFADRLAARPAGSRSKIGSLPGSEIYRAGERAASYGNYSVRPPHEALREAGIPGIKYLDQGSRHVPSELETARKRYDDLLKYNLERGPIEPEGIAAAKRNLERLEAVKPSFNYVMFPGTEDKIRIMKKYGLAGAVPTMGALAAQDEYRQQE